MAECFPGHGRKADRDPIDIILPACPSLIPLLAAGDADAWALIVRLVRDADRGEGYVGDPPPALSTKRPAGSEGKIRLMIERVEHHEQPCRDDDAPPDPADVDKLAGRDKRSGAKFRTGLRRKGAS